ncbi:hypothetical protein pEaSNUABM8_00002 [Erwinia phage pEa_SNUABM_8]|nr:hypothetical protein pEaSNUABM8_00002 [Erwinia phage pEa_SNUABM_8]QVW54766.1 hypothetical protein pEaSNUABM4_00001 [Erwinia phage pEa_SNUABM_4]
MTPEQRRRHEDEQRRLRRLRQQNQGGSLSSVIDQHDDMVEAYTAPSSPSSCDSGSDSGGSCD